MIILLSRLRKDQSSFRSQPENNIGLVTSTISSIKDELINNIPMILKNDTLVVSEILEDVVNNIIVSSLLDYRNTNTTVNATNLVIRTSTVTVITTHERRVLSMLLLKNLNKISNITLFLIENVD